MAYINTTQNEKRYRELCSRYESKMRVRAVRIEQKRADLETEKKALQDINDELRRLDATCKITHELAKERARLYTERTKAMERVRAAENALNVEQIGEDNMKVLDGMIDYMVKRRY